MSRPSTAYRVTVWHANIKPESRDSSTLSDGAILVDPADVQTYCLRVQAAGGEVQSVRTIDKPSLWYESLAEFDRLGSMSLAELDAIRRRCLEA